MELLGRRRKRQEAGRDGDVLSAIAVNGEGTNIYVLFSGRKAIPTIKLFGHL